MKTCPFCAEEIQDAAIKCKHCGEFLDGSDPLSKSPSTMKWYFRTSFIILAVCTLGPLALPLIWWRPQTSRGWKIGLTVVILLVSWLLYRLTVLSVQNLMEYYKLLEGL